MKKVDLETGKVLSLGDKINHTLKSDGWVEIENILKNKINILNSIEQLPDNVDYATEIKIRVGTISIIKEWLSDIYSISNQYNETENALRDNIIQNYE